MRVQFYRPASPFRLSFVLFSERRISVLNKIRLTIYMNISLLKISFLAVPGSASPATVLGYNLIGSALAFFLDSVELLFRNNCQVYTHMPEGLNVHNDAIEDYFVHMECSGPKLLAHYAGYIIANNILPWVEPGYRADYSQTAAFAAETEKYMGFLQL